MLEASVQFPSTLKRIRKISIIKEAEIEMMKLTAAPQDDKNVKIKTEKEMEMTTDLLAEAGVEEPKILGCRYRSIRTSSLLIIYLFLCTVNISNLKYSKNLYFIIFFYIIVDQFGYNDSCSWNDEIFLWNQVNIYIIRNLHLA